MSCTRSIAVAALLASAGCGTQRSTAGLFVRDIHVEATGLAVERCELTYEVESYEGALLLVIPVYVLFALAGGGGGGGGGLGDMKSERVSAERCETVVAKLPDALQQAHGGAR